MTSNLKKSILLIVLTVLIAIGILQIRPSSEPRQGGQPVPSGSSRLSELLSDQGLEGYAQASESRDFVFPDDHGPHPELPQYRRWEDW